MREIVFDTETTGFRPEDGERIIEIGAIELVNRSKTGRTFHEYINPEGRSVDPGAFAVHGISNEFLKDKKSFREIAETFLDFIDGAFLIAHNAPFDINFLNHEFARVEFPPIDNEKVIDTLDIARRKFPMAQNSLDRLCDRFGVNNQQRTLHGALLDSELLSEVYIELLGGRQSSLDLVSDPGETQEKTVVASTSQSKPTRKVPLPVRLTANAIKAHADFVEALGENAIWKRFG
jgi:DNA polymerase-3 subunit epsilon